MISFSVLPLSSKSPWELILLICYLIEMLHCPCWKTICAKENIYNSSYPNMYLKLGMSCWNYNTCIQLEELSRENWRRTKSLLRHLRRVVFLELQEGKILAKCAFQLVRMVLLTATCCKAYDGFHKMNVTLEYKMAMCITQNTARLMLAT